MKAIIPASTISTGTRVTACCRRGPRQSKTTSSFLNIVDVFSLTETHLEQKCFRGASTYRLRNCWRLGKAQGWPYSSQKPSSPSAELCSWNLFTTVIICYLKGPAARSSQNSGYFCPVLWVLRPQCCWAVAQTHTGPSSNSSTRVTESIVWWARFTW